MAKRRNEFGIPGAFIFLWIASALASLAVTGFVLYLLYTLVMHFTG